MRISVTYQGWLEPLVSIDNILLLYSVAIFLECLCDIKLNRIIIMTADPSIDNMSHAGQSIKQSFNDNRFFLGGKIT